MKILIVNSVIFNLNGISSCIMSYYKAFKEKYRDLNVDIDFIAADFIDDSYANIIKSYDDKIIYIPRKDKKPFKYFRSLKKIIKNNNYDLVYIHGNSSLMLIEILCCGKVKYITHAHNTSNSHKVVSSILKPFFRKKIKDAFACSNAAGIFAYGEKKEFTVIKNSIDIEKFLYNENNALIMRKKYNVTNDKIILFHCGNFNKQKNQEFIIELLKKLPRNKYFLVMVGSGANYDYIKNKINNYELDKEVALVGNTKEIEKYYSMADIFLLPSLYESFGIAVLEAQINGLNCIVSKYVPDDAILATYVEKLDLQIDKWVEKIENLKCSKRNKYDSTIFKEYNIKHSIIELKTRIEDICGKNELK